MSKRMMILLAGVAMTALSTGCCCMNKCNPCGYGGYGAGYGTSPCGPGGCAPTYGSPATPMGYSSGYEAAAFAPTTTITSTPIYTQTTMMQSLPPF